MRDSTAIFLSVRSLHTHSSCAMRHSLFTLPLKKNRAATPPTTIVLGLRYSPAILAHVSLRGTVRFSTMRAGWLS